MKQKTKFKQTEIGTVPEDWELRKVKDVASINEFSINKSFPYNEIYYIDIDSVDQRNIKNIKKLELSEAPTRAKRIVRDNDIIISTVRPNMKHFSIIKSAKANTIVSTGFVVITSKKTNPHFLYYYLTTDKYTNFLASIADSHTSTYPSFNPDVIGNSIIPLPSTIEQQFIAKILSDLDSKIELNQQMNKTLEAIGKAIFKHWFIDFEFPNEEGKPYKSSGGEMVYNEELGREIPKGWKLGYLGDIAENPRRGIRPDAVERGTAYIGLDHMPRQSIALSDWETVGEVISNKFQFYKGEILFGKLRPYFHKVGVAAVSGICSTDILVIVPKSPVWYGLALCHVSNEEFVNYTDAASTGTRMPRTNWEDMAHYEIVIPTNSVAQVFNNTILTLVQKISSNILQCRTLTTIRDSLLPKLMSGKIRVPVQVK